MNQFLGVNLLRQDPIEKAECVGFAREFHDWVIDQGKTIENGKASATFYYVPDTSDGTMSTGIYDLLDSQGTSIGTYNTATDEFEFNGISLLPLFFGYYFDEDENSWKINVGYYIEGAEACFNQIDDNGNSLIDCNEPQWCVCEGSPAYPNQEFKWNPIYQTQAEVNFDYFYDELNNRGLEICPAMQGSLPRLSLGEDYLLRKPIQWEGSSINPINPNANSPICPPDNMGNQKLATECPQSYLERADWIYHFLIRYGTHPSRPN